jgi:hypothetical protein
MAPVMVENRDLTNQLKLQGLMSSENNERCKLFRVRRKNVHLSLLTISHEQQNPIRNVLSQGERRPLSQFLDKVLETSNLTLPIPSPHMFK